MKLIPTLVVDRKAEVLSAGIQRAQETLSGNNVTSNEEGNLIGINSDIGSDQIGIRVHGGDVQESSPIKRDKLMGEEPATVILELD